VILEGSNKVLSKVLISGGGRCNVTNAIFKPIELAQYYPRGGDFLLEPFGLFSSNHTQQWFEGRGIDLKTEADGRVFPITDRSETIANVLTGVAADLNITTELSCRASSFEQTDNGGWMVETNQGSIQTDVLILTPGGSPQLWKALEKIGIEVVQPVPSLFTFHVEHPLLIDLPGISFGNVGIKIAKSEFKSEGPLLITHQGLSGPAVLKLSAWAAFHLAEVQYTFMIDLNWLGKTTEKELKAALNVNRDEYPKSYVRSKPILGLPKRFWIRLCELSGITEHRNWAETGKKQTAVLINLLLKSKLEVTGKSTNKDEFVTAGGVDLKQMDPKTFRCTTHQNLYMAGEVLNIDALTGGFNFQAAWTAGWMVGNYVTHGASSL
jgi:predicted Rossmann fold flavoprotein